MGFLDNMPNRSCRDNSQRVANFLATNKLLLGFWERNAPELDVNENQSLQEFVQTQEFRATMNLRWFIQWNEGPSCDFQISMQFKRNEELNCCGNIDSICMRMAKIRPGISDFSCIYHAPSNSTICEQADFTLIVQSV